MLYNEMRNGLKHNITLKHDLKMIEYHETLKNYLTFPLFFFLKADKV